MYVYLYRLSALLRHLFNSVSEGTDEASKSQNTIIYL